MRKRIVGIFMAFMMAVGLIAPINVMASGEAVIVTIGAGQVFEFRNLTETRQNIRFVGDSGVNLSYLRYTDAGHLYNGWMRLNMEMRGFWDLHINPGGKLVLGVEGAGDVVARGDLGAVLARRLVSPVFYTRPVPTGSSSTFYTAPGFPQVPAIEHRPRQMLTDVPSTSRLDWTNLSGGGRMTVHYPDGSVRERSIYNLSVGIVLHSGRGPHPIPHRVVFHGGSPSRTVPYRLFYGDYIAWGSKPYRLTADGQRSFPPGLEQDLLPHTSAQDQISGFSRDARIMFNMIQRTNHNIRPFGDYTRAMEIARGRQSNNDARMQSAYIAALEAMVRGESNTHLERTDAMGELFLSKAVTLIPKVGGFADTVQFGADASVNVLRNLEALDRRTLRAYEDLLILLLIYQNTNDQNLRNAVIYVTHNAEGLAEGFEVVQAALQGLGSATLNIVTGGIYGIFSTVTSFNRINSDAADRIVAHEGIRQALWGAYGQIINSGRHNNQYTESDLLLANNLWLLLNYFTREQNLWATSLHGTLRDARLQEEAAQLGFIGFSPMWYPYNFSSQLPNRSQEVADGLARVEGVNAWDVHDAPSSWAAGHVQWAVFTGILPQNLRYNYRQPITRGEFAALAVSLYEGLRGEIGGRTTFADTDDANVQKAAYIGVVSGVGNNMFAPNNRLSREQAAVMLSRLATAIGRPLPNHAPNFPVDGHLISPWAHDAVGQVQAAGIMSGIGDDTFGFDADFTREQSIVTMAHLWHR